ncbi:MAG TPA: 5-oxoprolinase subunit PxpB [Rhodanobacteraceae bacterium]
MTTVAIAEPLAEDALLLRFGDSIDPQVNARVHAAAARLRAAKLPDVSDIAPGYTSLLVRFDPFAWGRACARGEAPHARLLAEIDPLLRKTESDRTLRAQARVVEIPVCYGGEFGPDMRDIAAHARLDAGEFAARHTAAEYTVAMLGFAPGFPYLFGLDPTLNAPRRASPRTRVPAGSVAIGGAQTGIYPRELPGGWQIIGRTPSMLFDPGCDPPSLLAPGDRVRFRAIDTDEFAALVERAA